jgi:hypothetical protein
LFFYLERHRRSDCGERGPAGFYTGEKWNGGRIWTDTPIARPPKYYIIDGFYAIVYAFVMIGKMMGRVKCQVWMGRDGCAMGVSIEAIWFASER